jgi:molybdopterin-synthase adenylyltransferase
MAIGAGEPNVLVVGAGGLGCPATLALAKGGIRAMTLVDPDRVDETNLHRQLWHRTSDVGRLKVESARAGLERTFPGIRLRTEATRLDQTNALSLFAGHDLVLDCTDGIGTKFLLSDTAVRTKLPLIYAGAVGFDGQLMPVVPGDGGPCLRCLFEDPPAEDAVPTCAQSGVLGPVPGLIGAMQALLALRILQGREMEQKGQASLRVFDGRSLLMRSVTVRRASDCRVCSGARGPARGRGAVPGMAGEGGWRS